MAQFEAHAQETAEIANQEAAQTEGDAAATGAQEAVEAVGASNTAVNDPAIDVPTLAELFEKQEFHVAALFGALVVLIDALRRYGDIAFERRPNDVVLSITPRFLSTSADYTNSFALYVFLRLLTYALPALAFLYIFSGRGMTEALGLGIPEYFSSFITHQNFPLFWGAVIAGVLPSFTFVKDMELAMRRAAQMAGGIPSGVRKLVRMLRRAPLTPTGSFSEATLRTDRFALVKMGDFAQGAGRIEQKWARACYILDFFLHRGAHDAIKGEFIDAYRAEIEREEARFRSLQIRFAIHRLGYEKVSGLFSAEELGALPKSISTHDPYLEEDIDYLLGRLETYLAAATRYSENGEEKAIAALRKSGFSVARPAAAEASPLGGLLATLASLVVATVIGAASAYYFVLFIEDLGLARFNYDVAPGETVIERIFNVLVYQLMIVTAVVFPGFALGSVLFNISSRTPELRPLPGRPIVKYILSSAFGMICGLVLLSALVVDVSRPLQEAGEYSWILYWAPSLFVLCLCVHLFAYGPDRGLVRLIFNSVVIGLIYGGAVYFTCHKVFAELGIRGKLLEGAALYYGVISFWTGLFVSAAIIYLHKRQRDYRLQQDQSAEEEAAKLYSGSETVATT